MSWAEASGCSAWRRITGWAAGPLWCAGREREVAEVTLPNRGRALARTGVQLGMPYGLFVGEFIIVRRHTRQFSKAWFCRDEGREGGRWRRGRSFPR